MAGSPNLANLDYVARVNRAIDHVTRNLDAPLGLEEVAKVAAFSPFHFHRVFRAVTGETLHEFVKRVRLERAVFLMSRAEASLTEIALACGFSSSSDFSRSFKARFGSPPSEFDVARFRREGRDRFDGQLLLQKLPIDPNPRAFAVRLRELPERRIAYQRVFEPFQGGALKAAQAMLEWARQRGLEKGQWLGYQWDDPEIVPLEKCRYDLGLELPPDAPCETAEVRFPPMKVAEIAIKGPIEDELRAIDWIYNSWLPRSGFSPDHQPLFEAWDGLPFAHGAVHFELRLQLAVT